ncbi:fumarylacetoacetate hydrolase family protein [Streptomyces violaceusniger]
MIAFLAGGAAVREAAMRVADRVADEAFDPDLAPQLPFAARSLRPFLLSPRHSEGVARGMAARYAPSEIVAQAQECERTEGETFPSFRPRPLMLTLPLLYQGNHNALVPSGTAIAVPPYGHDLDFELELGFVVCRDVRDAGLEECRKAIGGVVVLNDVSLRDTQWEELHGSPLGPVQKCKSFATAMSSEVLTADAVLDDLASLSGTVDVDGERWARGRADDFAHTLEACLARVRGRGRPGRRAVLDRHAGGLQRHRARAPAAAGGDGCPERAAHRHRDQPIRRRSRMSTVLWPGGHAPDGAALHVVNTATSTAPPEAVWAWLTRPDRWSEYYNNVRRVRHVSGPWPIIALGSTFTWWTFNTRVTTEVTEVEPYERLAWTGHGLGSRGHHAWILTARADGGTGIHTEETQRGAASRLFRPVLVPNMRREHQRWVDELGRRAETGRRP